MIEVAGVADWSNGGGYDKTLSASKWVGVFYGSRFRPMRLNVLGHQYHLPQRGHSSCDL